MNKRSIWFIIGILSLATAGGGACAQDSGLAAALQASYAAEANNNYAAAIMSLRSAGASATTNYLAQARFGWLHYCNQEWEESVSRYSKAIRIAPAAIEPQLGIMLPLMALGKNDEAMRTAQAVLKQDPNNYTALSRTAWLLYLRQDYRKAAAIYRQLSTWYPSDAEMLLGLGYALKAVGDKEAAQCFQMVLLLRPNNQLALDGLSAGNQRRARGQ
ncbi:MAG: tetratricopeptide repeat protein [Verrucomicrobia bacterium]|nr:tetratricopeptide repeat protein [Verrucomicrobiota bacterium]